jgi:hypothetical protein
MVVFHNEIQPYCESGAESHNVAVSGIGGLNF